VIATVLVSVYVAYDGVDVDDLVKCRCIWCRRYETGIL